VEQKQSAIYITMNRPSVRNAFNEHVIEELHRAFASITNKQDARCVVLSGAGNTFSAGADVNWMAKMANYTKDENRADSVKLFAMFAAIKTCPLPTIARINGPALGGGAGLAAACDIAITHHGASFGLTEVCIGLIPAVISRFVMDKIGKANCARYFLTGERFSGPVAKHIGLVNDSLATPDDMDEAVSAIVAQIAKASPAAVKRAKSLIEQVSHFESAQASEAFVTEEIASIRVSAEGQEGLKSFLEKRNPSWIK